jgi:glycosyltransferase involved in cell wall biosynthesis
MPSLPLTRRVSMGKVSVIITFIDGSPSFLEEAIESVLTQSHQDLELLLVNDGGSGACKHLALHYQESHPGTVRYLEFEGRENRGASEARNLGIRHSTGAYVAFLDADDIWLPGKLEEQVALLEAHPEAGMLYGNTLYWHSWTGSPGDAGRDFMPRLGCHPDRLVAPPALLPGFLSGRYAVPCMCSIVVRRDVLERVGGFENTFTGMYDDQVLYAKISLEAPIYVAAACWDRYRQHPSSMTANARSNRSEVASRSIYLEWLKQYLLEKGVQDEHVWKALRTEFWLGTLRPGIARRIKQIQKTLWRVTQRTGRRPPGAERHASPLL